MSNRVWCERIPIAPLWLFSSTDSLQTLFSPAHDILNYFFFIFKMYNSWTSSFTLIWGTDHLHPYVFVTHLPLVCDPTILRDALFCVCEGRWGIYYCLWGWYCHVSICTGVLQSELSLWRRKTWKCLASLLWQARVEESQAPFPGE